MLIREATLSGSFFLSIFNLLILGKIQTVSSIIVVFFDDGEVVFRLKQDLNDLILYFANILKI